MAAGLYCILSLFSAMKNSLSRASGSLDGHINLSSPCTFYLLIHFQINLLYGNLTSSQVHDLKSLSYLSTLGVQDSLPSRTVLAFRSDTMSRRDDHNYRDSRHHQSRSSRQSATNRRQQLGYTLPAPPPPPPPEPEPDLQSSFIHDPVLYGDYGYDYQTQAPSGQVQSSFYAPMSAFSSTNFEHYPEPYDPGYAAPAPSTSLSTNVNTHSYYPSESSQQLTPAYPPPSSSHQATVPAYPDPGCTMYDSKGTPYKVPWPVGADVSTMGRFIQNSPETSQTVRDRWWELTKKFLRGRLNYEDPSQEERLQEERMVAYQERSAGQVQAPSVANVTESLGQASLGAPAHTDIPSPYIRERHGRAAGRWGKYDVADKYTMAKIGLRSRTAYPERHRQVEPEAIQQYLENYADSGRGVYRPEPTSQHGESRPGQTHQNDGDPIAQANPKRQKRPQQYKADNDKESRTRDKNIQKEDKSKRQKKR